MLHVLQLEVKQTLLAPSPDIVIGGLKITNEMDVALISLAVLETIMPNYGKNYNIY